MIEISDSHRIAYFSMEIALEPSIPTYSGGLGVLAGDTLRSAADLGVPMVACTLLHRKGYFDQVLDAEGNQRERPVDWNPEKVLEPMNPPVVITIEGRQVFVRAWRYPIRGISGHVVPVYLLDTALPENSEWDQTLTGYLYGGDQRYRLCQEVVLGMGGVGVLCALGHCDLETYHMNEGHAALLGLALVEESLDGRRLSQATREDLRHLQRKCIFTTHTPVPAGHDQFPRELVLEVLGEERTSALERAECFHSDKLNMTYVALRSSHYINGVAMHHGQVSRGMFPNYPVRAITNGVHALTWTSPAFRALYDRHIPEWRHDNLYLRYAVGISPEEIRQAHSESKRALFEAIQQKTGVEMNEGVLTIGFARRATAYKRPGLFFSDLERLRYIARYVGPFQVVYAGKAHPKDPGGKAWIHRVFEAAESLQDVVRVAYVENYDMRWGQLITSGVDLWMNTPKRPEEASGTSGMKAALNGVPSFSVLDGWWIEGHIEGVTGWAIGDGEERVVDDSAEAASLYDKLERVILPLYYQRPTAYAQVMRSAIAINASFFNTQRMLSQYIVNAYFPEIEQPADEPHVVSV